MQHNFELDPTQKFIFGFCNRQRNRIKLLVWEDHLCRESKDGWFDMAKQYCQNITTPRKGKTVYIGSDWRDVVSKQFEKEFTLRAGYEITERTVDKFGQILLVPDVEVETWWTNLGESDQAIIDLYHAHRECEQFHSEIKRDMDLERLPSGKFATNALILELITYSE